MPIIYLNGKFVEQLEASLDPLDRGVLLGDGIFETIRCEEGQLLFHVAHFSRLGRSARITEIPWNMPSEDLLAICQQVLDANNLDTARLRITLTRGEMGGSPEIGNSSTAPTLIVHAGQVNQETFDEMRTRGWRAGVVPFPINHRSPLAGVKSTSYLEHLLAKRAIRRDGYDEGIMLNTDGLVAEGTMTNLFVVKGETLITPPVADGALPGILRLKIGLLSARMRLEYREDSITIEDLHEATEAFMTNSLVEVNGVKIGNGEPGPITHSVYSEHRKDIDMFLHTMRHS